MKAGLAIVLSTLGFVAVLSGCPKPPPPVVVMPSDLADLADLATAPASRANLALPELAACPVGIDIVPENTCESLVTADGLQCVSCRGASGCVLEAAMIYCVARGCVRDPRCRADPDFKPALRHKGGKK